jgi:integration host factor subunit alpha
LKSIKLHGWPFAVQPEGAPRVTTTKSDLIHSVADANGFPLKRSVEIVETLIDLVKTNLAGGEDVLISGFGKFCIKKKRERRGRNPATGKDMMLEARRVVTFKCSGQLRDKINKSQ